jgi:small subunit ribosomal protein S16
MMMLRLARMGSKKRPVYQLVAADRRARRDGRHVENLGYYVPATDVLVFKQDRVDYWLGQGAQPTGTADRLIRRARKEGNQEPKAKPKYVPPPAKPVEAKKAEPTPAAEATPTPPPESAAPAEPPTDAPAAESSEA